MKHRYIPSFHGVCSGIFTLLLASVAWAEGLTLSQCANGGINDPVPHTSCHEGWISGNANAQKAAYAEGDLVPYRVVLTGLIPGNSYTYTFSWDTLKSGQHAIDYIGTYNDSAPAANACVGVAATCPGTVSTMSIPADPVLTGVGVFPPPGEMTLFGGTITGVGDYGSTSIADAYQSISVVFTPDQSTAVLTWGGHISTPLDWGDGNTASDISGSPYHTSNVSLVDHTGEPVGGGRQDVALSAAAVFVPSVINVIKRSNAPGVFQFESFLDGNREIPPEGEVSNPWTLAKDQEKTIDAMDEGTVTLRETGLPEGDWRISSIVCSRQGEGVVFSYTYGEDEATDTAIFEVDEASTFSCVFENEFFGAPVLNVIKRVVDTETPCSNEVRDSDAYDSLNIHSGATVRYCYWVTNSGGDAAIDVTLIDDRAGLADPMPISLVGGSEINGDAAIPDLAVGETLSGSLEVALNVVLNSTVINTADASGTGQWDGQTYSATDTATVFADQVSSCSLKASVYTGNGSCPGTTTAYILKDSFTDANWCAEIDWDANAALDLSAIEVTLEEDPTVFSSGADMAPAGEQTIAVGTTNPNANFTGTLTLTGSEGGLNPISCSDNATVNVLSPGLTLVKLASKDDICGNADDAHEIEIYNGDPAYYCLTVINTGDTRLENISVSDPLLSDQPIPVGTLEAFGNPWSWTSPATYPEDTVTNTAVATSTEPLTGSTIDSDESTARVVVLKADVRLWKSVDQESIVLCDPPDAHDFCTEHDGNGIFPVDYTLNVKNLGPDTATGVSVSDELPVGFVYLSNDSGCSYDEPGHLVSCNLGDMDAGLTIEVVISGVIDVTIFDRPWQTVTNGACAAATPVRLDPDPSNNCDQASTHISTGPTRTIGWWKNHTLGRIACTSAGPIELGFLDIRDEAFDGDIDATISTDTSARGKYKSSLITAVVEDDKDDGSSNAVEMMKGLVNADTAKWGDGTHRSRIGQARVIAGRQLAASWCNEVTFASEFDDYFLGWPAIQKIMAGEAYLEGDVVMKCGGPCDQKQQLGNVIDSILFIGSVADEFNNSGHEQDIALDAGSANPGAAEDDPTDPAD